MNLQEYFLKLRFDKSSHIGLGDIRLTLGQQDEILDAFAARPEGAQQYRDALDKAAYALFQLKRFVDMPEAAIDFCRKEHAKACAVLNVELPQGESGK